MPMAGVGTRRKVYRDVITFPTTKNRALDGDTVILLSDQMYPFEKTGWGPAKVIVRCDDPQKIASGDSIHIKTWVTYDQGDTGWILMNDESATLHNDGASSLNIKKIDIPLARRLKCEAHMGDSFGDSDILSSGHGIGVDVVFEELDPESKRVGDTIYAFSPIGDSVDGTFTSYGDSLTINSPNTLYVFAYSADRSKYGDSTAVAFSYESDVGDSGYWFGGDSFTTASPSQGTGIYLSALEEKTVDLSERIRIKAYAAGDTTIASGHNTKFYVMALE